LKNENLKLNSDIKVIRNDHFELASSIEYLEHQNNQLNKENFTLKDIIYGKQTNKEVKFRAKIESEVQNTSRNPEYVVTETSKYRESPFRIN